MSDLADATITVMITKSLFTMQEYGVLRAWTKLLKGK